MLKSCIFGDCVTPWPQDRGAGREFWLCECAELQQQRQEMLTLLQEALQSAHGSVGGYFFGEQSLINPEPPEHTFSSSFPSHRCLCSLIKSLFCFGYGLNTGFLASLCWSESQGIWCVRAAECCTAAPSFSPSPSPHSLCSHHSHLNTGAALTGQTFVWLLAPGARACLDMSTDHLRRGSFSPNTDFPAPLPGTKLLGMSSPSRNLSIYTGFVAGAYSGPSCWCLSSVF